MDSFGLLNYSSFYSGWKNCWKISNNYHTKLYISSFDLIICNTLLWINNYYVLFQIRCQMFDPLKRFFKRNTLILMNFIRCFFHIQIIRTVRMICNYRHLSFLMWVTRWLLSDKWMLDVISNLLIPLQSN